MKQIDNLSIGESFIDGQGQVSDVNFFGGGNINEVNLLVTSSRESFHVKILDRGWLLVLVVNFDLVDVFGGCFRILVHIVQKFGNGQFFAVKEEVDLRTLVSLVAMRFAIVHIQSA